MNAKLRCPHCNALLPATSRICVMCGKTQNWAEDIPDEDLEKAQQHLVENPPAPPKLETKILWTVGIVVLFVVTLPVTFFLSLFLLFIPLGVAVLAAGWFLWDIWKPSK